MREDPSRPWCSGERCGFGLCHFWFVSVGPARIANTSFVSANSGSALPPSHHTCRLPRTGHLVQIRPLIKSCASRIHSLLATRKRIGYDSVKSAIRISCCIAGLRFKEN
jgi:hypothetical protein